MCGIVGIWQRDGRALDLDALRGATDALRHRGPDDEGYLLAHVASRRVVSCGGSRTAAGLGLPALEAFRGESFDLGLGFRRLAVLDPSPAGHQPMASPDGRLWVVFNGEIYNFLELREELRQRGFEFRTRSDTEVILAAFRCWGEDCVQRFVGMWAMVIWDVEARRMFVSRDRFGIKPLFVAETDGRFACASEIKALVGPHGIPFEPEEPAIFDYLAAAELPSPLVGGTFFRGIRALPAAHDLVVEATGSRRRRYWDIPAAADEASPSGDAVGTIDRYRELFSDAVRLHLRSDVALGTCLSGGVDSSSIVCVMNRLITAGDAPLEATGGRQNTFSAVYGDGGRHDEGAHIDRVVGATGVDSHRTVPSAARLRADLDRLVWHQDEPFPTTSIFAQWCVMDLVHDRGVTVLLDGQGADEVLAGYRPFRLHLADVLRRQGPGPAFAAASAIRSRAGESAAGLLAAALLYQLPRGWMGGLRGRRPWSRAHHQVLDRGLRERYAGARRAREMGSTLDAHLRAQVREESLPHLLRYEDRNSMAFGVEARVPFLDHRLVEYSFAEAAPWRVHDGWTKWVLRKAMDGWVPPEVVWRRDKVGFETPEAGWLREWARDEPGLFRDEALVRPYLDPVAARRAAAAWAAGDGRHPPPLWRWINLEAWLRVWRSVGGAPGRG